MTNPVFNQIAFRIRNDNGSESTATWRQNINVSDSLDANTPVRVRFRIDETASRAWTNKTWNIYYSLNSAAYAAVDNTTPIQWSSSSNFAQGDNCTAQLSGGTGTFVTANAGMCESAGATNSGSAGNLFEVEYCLHLDVNQLANGDTIDLEVYDGTGAIGGYTNVPRLTVAARKVNVSDGTTVGDNPVVYKNADPEINVSDGTTVGDSSPSASFVYPDRTVVLSRVSSGSDDASMAFVPTTSGRNVTVSAIVYISETSFNLGDTGSDSCTIGAARFQNIDIVQGATITSANFFFFRGGTDIVDPFIVRLFFSTQASDNAAQFVEVNGNLNVSNRPRSTNYASAEFGSGNTGDKEIIDVTSSVQEIIDRAGWAELNAIVILIDVDPLTDPGRTISFATYNLNYPDYYAGLEIFYSTSSDTHIHASDGTTVGSSVTLSPLALNTINVTDGITLSDSGPVVSRQDAVTLLPNVTDGSAVGETRNLAPLVLPTIAQTDGTSLGDSNALAPLTLNPVQVSDPLGVQEITNAEIIGNEPPQTVNVSDGTSVGDQASYYSDSVAVGEVVQVFVLASPNNLIDVSDGVITGDSVTIPPLSLVFPSGETDSVTLGEVVATSKATLLVSGVSDNTTLGDSDSITPTALSLAATDNITLADSASANVNATFTPAPSVTDSTTVADTPVLSIALNPVSVTDGATLGDTSSITPLLISRSDVSDAVSVGEIVSASFASVELVNVTDDTVVGETVSVSRTIPGTPIINATDSTTLTDTPQVNLIALPVPAVNVADNTAVGDTPSVSVGQLAAFTINISDGATIGETLSAVSGTLIPQATDNTALGDTPVLSIPASLLSSVVDNIAVGETNNQSVAAVGIYVLSTSDGVVVSDVPLVNSQLMIVSVSDGTVVGEIRNVTALAPGVFTITITDNAAVAESQALRNNLFGPNLVDNQGVSDSVSVIVNAVGSILINKTDGVTVGEALNMAKLLLAINTSNAVILGDSSLVGFGGVGQAIFKGMWRGMRKKEQ